MISGIGAISPEFLTPSQTDKPTAAAQGGSDFGVMMADLASGTVSSLRNADNMAVQGLAGTASTREVVDTVMQAEQALQASIAIRDKIVTAYLETSRMAI